MKDPYRYFRVEADELIGALGRDLLALESGDLTLVRQLLRHAHTLKGAAGVVKLSRIAALAHRLEDLLNTPEADRAAAQAMATLDEIRDAVAALDGPPKPAARPEAPASDDLRSVRVEVDQLDALLASISEALSARDGIEDALASLQRGELEGARRALSDDCDRLGRELDALRAAATELRLVPVSVLATELDRTARDAARALDRTVRFEVLGGESRIDAGVLSSLRSALRHVVRNAVVHGIEDADGRRSAGKPPEGVVRLAVERTGDRVVITCSDDGRGLDVSALRRAAGARGLAQGADQLTDADLTDLLLRGGLSTSGQVTDLAGRGVGLDVVRDTAQRLRGEVVLRSQQGAGLEVTLTVPVTLAGCAALEVAAGDCAALLPLDSIAATRRIDAGDLCRTTEGDRLVVDGRGIPYASLDRLLAGAADGSRRIAVLLRAAGAEAAVGVDALGDIATAVVRPIPAHVAAPTLIAGASTGARGVPTLVLDAPALIRAVQGLDAAPAPAPAPVRRPILVIDDSLTTRMLEKNILESEGYDVELAISGEQGLSMARQRRYGLFVVDVEMPGMSGFEFIEHVRADDGLRDIPAILVTSRSNPEDLRRGRDVGASGYMVKSEFDQEALLGHIASLIT